MNAALILDAAGRVVLPARIRKALDLKEGSRLLLALDGQVVTLTPMRETIRRAQAILAPYRPKDGRLLSDDLVAERREEYRREQESGAGAGAAQTAPGRGPKAQVKPQVKPQVKHRAKRSA